MDLSLLTELGPVVQGIGSILAEGGPDLPLVLGRLKENVGQVIEYGATVLLSIGGLGVLKAYLTQRDQTDAMVRRSGNGKYR